MREESLYRKNLKEKAGYFAIQTVIPLLSEEQKVVFTRDMLSKITTELQYNIVFDAGFNISVTDALSQDFCYCPLSSLFSKLHRRLNTSLVYHKHCNGYCNVTQKMNPFELVKHLLNCHTTCVLHKLTYLYIKYLYVKHWTDYISHYALHQNEGCDYFDSIDYDKYVVGNNRDSISKGFTNFNYPENNGAFKARLKYWVDKLGQSYNKKLMESGYDSNNALNDKYMNMIISTPPLVVNRISHNNSKDDSEMDNKDDIKSDTENNSVIDEKMDTKEDEVDDRFCSE